MSNHVFSRVPKVNPPRSTFDMTHRWLGTFNAGRVIPFYLEEIVPGDTFRTDVSVFCRLASPLSVPLMSNMYVDVQFFFVPMRLVWENWERMHGAQDYPGASTDYLTPAFPLAGAIGASSGADLDNICTGGFSTIANYMGLNGFALPRRITDIGALTATKVSALPLRAYWLIWNEWYRDENLQSSLKINVGDGNDSSGSMIGTWFDSSTKPSAPTGVSSAGLMFPAPRGKRHDYFTSALPAPQKGPGVELPLGTTAPVYGTGMSLGLSAIPNNGTEPMPWGGLQYNGSTSSAGTLGVTQAALGSPIGTAAQGVHLNKSQYLGVSTNPETSGLVADLSQSTAITINSLRQAFQLQKLYERDSRGGSRYPEILLAHYGVVSPDARLQRPEYLGGFSMPMNVNVVAQTSPATGSAVADLAAFAQCGASRFGYRKSFVEFGYVLGMISVRADLDYQQGVPRLWSRSSRVDYYYPVFSHLGEQAVLAKEIYATGVAESDDVVFGYQERYAELRYHPSVITSGFNSALCGTPLDAFHLGQKFASQPRLNTEFIEENPPVNRVSAVSGDNANGAFLCQAVFNSKATRELPLYGVPSLVDHF